MKLSSFAAGDTVLITAVAVKQPLANRLYALGVRTGSRVRILRRAPFGGGLMLEADGVRLAVRLSLADQISALPAKGEEDTP